MERTLDSIDQAVKSVQAGDIEAYRTIVLHFQRRLHAYCYRMLGEANCAEDAVQDIFLKGYTHIGAYEPRAPFGSWLYKIAYHHCVNLIRSRERGRWLLESLKQRTIEDSRAYHPSDAAERLLAGLSAEERHIVILRTVEGYSFEEIGDMIGLKAAAVRKRFERIRKKARRQWEQEEFVYEKTRDTSTGSALE